MNPVALHHASLDIIEYDQKTQVEIKQYRDGQKTLFWNDLGFAAASVVALYFDAFWIAGALFLLSRVFHDGALEKSLKEAMIETNWSLALLIHSQAVLIEQLRQEMKERSR